MMGGRGGFGGPGRGVLMRGITLSDAEKARLKALRPNKQSQLGGRRDQALNQRAAMRAARQRGDTAAMRASMQARRMETQKAMEARNAAIRAALSPDNQAKFDSNIERYKNRRVDGQVVRRRRGDE
jgi:Spy/CpxP family protein refolding chaperone